MRNSLMDMTSSMPTNWLRLPNLSPECKMTSADLLILARMFVFSSMDDTKEFPCPVAHLMNLFRFSRRTVIRALKVLTEGHYVFKTVSKNGCTPLYKINFNHPDFIQLNKDSSTPPDPALTEDDKLLSENPPCETKQDNNLQPVSNCHRCQNDTPTGAKMTPLRCQNDTPTGAKMTPHIRSNIDLKDKDLNCSSREGKQIVSAQNTTQQNVNTLNSSLSQNPNEEVLPHVPGVPPAQQCPKDANECLEFFTRDLKAFIAQDPQLTVASTLIHWELLAQNFLQYYNARNWRNVTDWRTRARQWAIKEANHALLDQKRQMQGIAKNAPLPQSTEEYKNNVEAIGQRLYDYFNDPNSFENRMAAERAKKDKDNEIIYLDNDC